MLTPQQSSPAAVVLRLSSEGWRKSFCRFFGQDSCMSKTHCHAATMTQTHIHCHLGRLSTSSSDLHNVSRFPNTIPDEIHSQPTFGLDRPFALSIPVFQHQLIPLEVNRALHCALAMLSTYCKSLRAQLSWTPSGVSQQVRLSKSGSSIVVTLYLASPVFWDSSPYHLSH